MPTRPATAITLLALAFGGGLLASPVLRDTFADSRSSVETLLPNSAYETPLYILDSGREGSIVLVLGGVHGDEPSGWLAAEELVARGPPLHGKLLVIPRANRLAIDAELRSTPSLGDLNRLYFAPNDAFPMGRMARAIEEVVRRYDVDVLLDLHESWDFHQGGEGADVDLGALGQTISPHRSQPSRRLAARVVSLANTQIPGLPRFHYHEFPEGYVDAILVPLPAGTDESDVPRKSGLDLPSAVPSLASILVEVGQQQPLAHRVRQQLAVAEAVLALAR